MFPFSRDPQDPPAAADAPAPAAPEAHPLDALTGGVFSAATSGERAQRVRQWLATEPAPEQMQEVFKELSAKDKGAAKALRERLDELRRAREQEAVAAEWETRARALLDGARLNIADALAWQRDAAKAGAPLSREPLASLRAQLTERVRTVEDLQQRVMVQREAAALLAQRIELLSTQPWTEARDAQPALEADLAQWREQAELLRAEAQWPSIDLRFAPQLESAQAQLEAVWSAFVPALAQAQAASSDATAALPPVPVWAEELRAARAAAAGEAVAPTARPKVDPEQRAAAMRAVEAGVMLLEQAVGAGHTKNMNSATQALRQSLKTHGRLIDEALEARVHAALVSAGELGGWQRWSADKAREQLVARAEALLVRRPRKGGGGAPAPDASAAAAPQAESIEPVEPPQTAPVVPEPSAEAAAEPAESPVDAPTGEPAAETLPALEGADEAGAEPAPPADADFELVPTLGGRKLQEAIRKLREEWKTADQGGPPNHALWKRFDRACNAAHRFVEAWLDQVRAQAAEHRSQRLALIEEVKAWGAAQQAGPDVDWKAMGRQIHQFSERWRNAGHLAEKAFAELQPQWKAAIHAAGALLEAEQKASTLRRQALIAEAEALAAEPRLRIDAVRALQQRWQAEAQAVPLERRHEQKLWDAFRKPLDAAFNRKSAEREQERAALSAHDQAVLQAAKALEAANASGDAQRIRAAMEQLEAVSRGPLSKAAVQDAGPVAPEAAAPLAEGADAATPPRPDKPLIAMRGDDRPGARQPGADARAAGDRREHGPAGRDARRGPAGAGRFGDRRDGARGADRGRREERGPRLGDTAFRAQRQAVESAQAALRKLAAQAHGEALVQLLTAWQERDPALAPSAQELGRAVSASVRNAWLQAIGAGGGDRARAATALLRLEMAAEVPAPADQQDARRALQLQLLTRRNDPQPAETWREDAATLFATEADEVTTRRAQAALKVLLRR
ncbi:MAG TPA: DUF349 domain-containing protein [Ottowia sp.]|uniref:DUF349 domain-containing protein n=1 Tax=Ottowia sp. TaxID=1898956 RepID=UPI002CF2B953|nr:DUF349 domain-containing protein [Ottowia sp.]HMN22698.1 DUF349 domain-containing protein [Ottowia sp.]